LQMDVLSDDEMAKQQLRRIPLLDILLSQKYQGQMDEVVVERHLVD